MELDKEKIRTLFLEILRSQIGVLSKSVAVATDATTHEDARSEGKYDTRAIESGYLAGAQANRLKELEGKRHLLEQMKFKSFSTEDPIEATALVLVGSVFYFILPLIGGLECEWQSKKVISITPDSAVGQAIMGLYVGDEYKDSEIHQIS